jgi:hypothetical protein
VWSTVITLASLVSSSLAASDFSKRGVTLRRGVSGPSELASQLSVNRFPVACAEVGAAAQLDVRTSPLERCISSIRAISTRRVVSKSQILLFLDRHSEPRLMIMHRKLIDARVVRRRRLVLEYISMRTRRSGVPTPAQS